jgi:hypothetical protein
LVKQYPAKKLRLEIGQGSGQFLRCFYERLDVPLQEAFD